MSGSDLTKLSITQAGAKLAAGECSALELVTQVVDKAAQENVATNSYLEVFADSAKAEAKQIDAKRSAGEELSPLAGIPLAIKDNILLTNQPVSAASKMLPPYRATYEATAAAKLRAAGVIFVGRTNMDEFAMGSSTENSAFGQTKNPHDTTRVPGGSSGGSAAAVAADLCLGALGSDTAGSIRQPAAFCGVVGLKTTYGAVSRYGLIALTSSLDQIGPITKSVADAEIIFNTIAGTDKMDSTSFYPDTPAKGKAKTIGVPYDFLASGIDKEVLANFEQVVAKFKALGYEIKDIKLPNVKYSLACYYIITPAEVSSNLARFDGMRYGHHEVAEDLLGEYKQSRGAGFGPEVRRRILLGTYVLSSGYYDAYYRQAVSARRLIKQDLLAAFNNVDAILTPTTPTTAFKLGEKTADPLQMYLADIFTVPANLAGVPAISLPSGKDSTGLPFGIQLMAPAYQEHVLFEVGKQFMGEK
jgi:aspartyl-tRNA(Asn)/glutamyl-tRNA(Gln) amidotransferase subunit A